MYATGLGIHVYTSMFSKESAAEKRFAAGITFVFIFSLFDGSLVSLGSLLLLLRHVLTPSLPQSLHPKFNTRISVPTILSMAEEARYTHPLMGVVICCTSISPESRVISPNSIHSTDRFWDSIANSTYIV